MTFFCLTYNRDLECCAEWEMELQNVTFFSKEMFVGTEQFFCRSRTKMTHVIRTLTEILLRTPERTGRYLASGDVSSFQTALRR